MPDRVVLAYSGGLDTSVAVRWLIENEGVEVVAVAVIVDRGAEPKVTEAGLPYLAAYSLADLGLD